MLSSSEYDYIHSLLLNYYNNGFENYVCITNNPQNSSNDSYDVFCYLSKDKITYSADTFSFKNGKIISFDSNNQSINNTIDKLKVENINNNFSILNNKKEFVYSNLVDFPDILGDYRTSLNNHLDLNFSYCLLILLFMIFITSFFKSIFRSRR